MAFLSVQTWTWYQWVPKCKYLNLVWGKEAGLGASLMKMLVSTTGAFQLVHSKRGGGAWVTPVHPGAANHTGKWNERPQTKRKKKSTIRQPARPAKSSRIQAQHTQTRNKKVKQKYFQKAQHLVFFISYIQLDSDINNSTRSIYFNNHFKVPLIFFWVFTTVQAKHTLQSAQI